MTFLKKIEQRAPWWCSIYRVFGLNVQKSWLFIRKSANIDCSIYRKARDRVIEDLDQTSIYRLIGVATLLGRFIFRESNHLLPNFKTANVNIWCGEKFISIDILSWSSFNFWTVAQKYHQTSLIACIGSFISIQRTG